MEDRHIDLKVAVTEQRCITFSFERRALDPETREFFLQIHTWKRNLPAIEAETAFLEVYLPGARVLTDAGLTDGLVFAYEGRVYWDTEYAVRSWLEDLLFTGTVSLRDAGPEADLEGPADPPGTSFGPRPDDIDPDQWEYERLHVETLLPNKEEPDPTEWDEVLKSERRGDS